MTTEGKILRFCRKQDREFEGEKFTVRLDVDGIPIEKAVPEMTAGEVAAAICWNNEEAELLEREAAQENDRWDPIVEADRESLPQLSAAELDAFLAHVALCENSAAALQKRVRLMGLICARLRACNADPQMSTVSALKQFWPRSHQRQ